MPGIPVEHKLVLKQIFKNPACHILINCKQDDNQHIVGDLNHEYKSVSFYLQILLLHTRSDYLFSPEEPQDILLVPLSGMPLFLHWLRDCPGRHTLSCYGLLEPQPKDSHQLFRCEP